MYCISTYVYESYVNREFKCLFAGSNVLSGIFGIVLLIADRSRSEPIVCFYIELLQIFHNNVVKELASCYLAYVHA